METHKNSKVSYGGTIQAFGSKECSEGKIQNRGKFSLFSVSEENHRNFPMHLDLFLKFLRRKNETEILSDIITG